MLKFMVHRGLFVATVGIPLAKCNNCNNNNHMGPPCASLPACHALYMAYRGPFVAAVGIPMAKCNNGNNNPVTATG
jgi:hypothetical protein